MKARQIEIRKQANLSADRHTQLIGDWADKHPHWISVEDELPKDYEPVLAAFANHFARVCFHCGKTWYLNKPLAAEEMEGITHWMHLPQPPKKGGKE